MQKIKTIKKTCDACPSQWEGELEDGRNFYIRYRFGLLTVRFGKNVGDSAIDQKTSYQVYELTHGNSLDGYMTEEELQGLTEYVFYWGE